MGTNPWFKFYGGEYLADPKIDQLTALERACWTTLLCLANVSNNGGEIENLKVFTLLTKSGIYPLDSAGEQMGMRDDYTENLGVLEHFQALEMVERTDVFSYRVKNWEKRQETALTAAERQAKYRENKKSNENVTGRVTKVTLEENRVEKKRIDTSATHVEIVPSLEESEKETRAPAKFPHAKEVFSWFPHPQTSWAINKTELAHAELLYERGEKKVRGALAFVETNKDEEYMPQITKPSDLERKWLGLVTYANKNNL